MTEKRISDTLATSVQFAKYAAVGGTTAGIYFFILFISLDVLALAPILSVSISYCCAISFHFLANKIFTFESRGGDVTREVARYLCMVLFNYLVTLLTVYLVVNVGGHSTYLGVAIAVAATVGIGYGITRFWVFKYDRGET